MAAEISQSRGGDAGGRAALMRNPTYWYYGLGAIPFGIKDNAFSYLLLIYANQCLGLPGWQASLAMVIALVWDSVTDLFLGHWSDKTHSRLGRRHPFMYVGLFVLPLSFLALFAPLMTLTEANTFLYVLALTLLIRTGVTLFEVPNVALLPDLETDYDQRNTWFALRYFLGWYGGNGIQVLNITLWVGALGFTNPQGYAIYGWVGAAAIAFTIAISAFGTQKTAAALPRPRESMRWREIGQEMLQMAQSLRNRNFAALFAYSLFFYIATGMGAALYLYIVRYFYGFSNQQMGFIGLAVFAGPLLAALVGPPLAARFGKKRVGIGAILTYVLFYPIVPLALLTGFWPGIGSWTSAYIVAAATVMDVTLLALQGILISSMVADVVEDSEVRTARRSEGLFFATRSFASKLISAGGIMGAGAIVTLVGFDAVQSLDDVTYDLRRDMLTLFAPAYVGILLLGTLMIGFYKIDRAQHQQNLAATGRAV